MPWASVPATIGGGAAGGGSGWAAGLGSGVISAFGQWSANRANLKESARNRAFQERMSNTAIQRRMEDMRKAGVNPILAARFDASTPPGAMANMENIGAAGTQGFSTGAASALAIRRQKQELLNMQAQAANTNADTNVKRQQQWYVMAQTSIAHLDASIREPLAWAAAAAMGALPAHLRNNPAGAKEFLIDHLQKFLRDNPDIATTGKLVLSALKNLATSLAQTVNEHFGPQPLPTGTGKPAGPVKRSDEPGMRNTFKQRYSRWLQYKKNGGRESWRAWAKRYGIDPNTGKKL